MSRYVIERLRSGDFDRARAHALFAVMAEAFEAERPSLGDAYVDCLLARGDMWILAARMGDTVVGGLTAHVLPMTRSESTELFIYDLAVHPDHQRKGVGRALIAFLRSEGRAAGHGAVFVPADDEDTHALDFYRAVGGEGAPVTIFSFE
jgi:aminoglycoside 3-N-acetyltransferase I